MKTEIVTVVSNSNIHGIDSDADAATLEALKKAGSIIRGGGLVAFPTETVYGLGGDALNSDSSRKIYAAKGRPSDNPLIVHISRWEDLATVARVIPKQAQLLARRFWPGPLTMIFQKTDAVPLETTGGLDTVAVRFPSHPIAQKFIEESGGFVAAPSANLSGRPSPAKARYVVEDMDGRIDMILDGGDVGIGIESTIIDLSGEVPVLLRPGYVTIEMLRELLPAVEVDPTILDGDCKQPPKAPGMRYRHYAPKGKLTIVEGERESVAELINRLCEEGMAQGRKVGVIATSENCPLYKADVVKNVGSRADEEEIAGNLYNILREFDDEDVEIMYSESLDFGGLGQAIMNRLLKAAGHEVIRA